MKIERIILFTKGIETLSFFSEQLGKTFSKLGYEVFYFDQCKSCRIAFVCQTGGNSGSDV